MGSAGFFRAVFVANVFDCVLFQRNCGIAALLRAIVHQAVFANVEIARPGPTAAGAGNCGARHESNTDTW